MATGTYNLEHINNISLNGGIFVKNDNNNIFINSGQSQNTASGECVAIGYFAGFTGQGYTGVSTGNAIAIGSYAGSSNQNGYAVAIGSQSGKSEQGEYAVAIGNNAAQENQSPGAVAIGNEAGQTSQSFNSVAIGTYSGQNSQSSSSVSIGFYAGQSNQGSNCVCIGVNSGQTGQGPNSVAIGNEAGQNSQGICAVAVGIFAGQSNQKDYSVAIGNAAGKSSQSSNSVAIGSGVGSTSQGFSSVAIGNNAGQTNQGDYSVAIGYGAGFTGQGDNTIVINADGEYLNTQTGVTGAFYVAPIRADIVDAGATGLMMYNNTTKEISYITAKTFVIDHPTKEDKRLVHACVEGPEAGIYYRGKNVIENDSVQITLPDYISANFGYDFTVNITPIYKAGINNTRVLCCSEVENGVFTVYGEPGPFHWLVFGKRGEIQVEIDKETTNIQGDGPYTYITDSPTDADAPCEAVSDNTAL
jgi:hypothetical protein